MKKIIFIISLIIFSNFKLFADFEMSINLSSRASYTMPKFEGKHIDPTTGGYENIKPSRAGVSGGTGALLQIGNSFNLKNTATSLSLLADIGYFLQTYSMINFSTTYILGGPVNYKVTEGRRMDISMHTLNIGTLFKVNAYTGKDKPYSIGIGGGLKFPFSGSVEIYDSDNKSEDKTHQSYSDIRKTYEYLFIPYVKFAAERYFYMSKRIAFFIGGFASYNFPMKYDIKVINFLNPDINLQKFEFSSVEIGLNLGFYFGREKRKPADTNVNSI